MAKKSSGTGQPARSREGPEMSGKAAIDPRVLVSRERVLTTTLDLLTETGLGELTIDDISRRSGVAKTTIYRHWANRSALVIDACSRMTDGQQAPPDTGSLEGDLRAILADIADLLGTARWSSILPSIVDAAEHDPEFAGIHSRIQHGHAAPLRAALDRAGVRGEIPPAADRNAIAAALLGPLFYRRWFSREQIDAELVEMIIRSALAGLHRDPRNPKPEQAATKRRS
jgi:AcrR family transcriptional regulator